MPEIGDVRKYYMHIYAISVLQGRRCFVPVGLEDARCLTSCFIIMHILQVLLSSSDGKTFEVDEKVASMSITIKEMIEGA